MGIRRFLRKLFHCKPKYNGMPIKFYRKDENGNWIEISEFECLDLPEYKIEDEKGNIMDMHTVTMSFTPISDPIIIKDVYL